MSLCRFLIHTQAITTSALFRSIPSARHSTLRLIYLRCCIAQRIATVAFCTILGPEVRVRRAHSCTLLDRHIRPGLPSVIQNTLVNAVRVAALVCETGDQRVHRRSDGCTGVEIQIEPRRTATVFLVISGAKHIALV